MFRLIFIWLSLLSIAHAAFLGVEYEVLTPISIKHYQVTCTSQGLYIRKVIPNSPAFNSGIKKSDVLLKIDGYPIETPYDFFRVLDTKKVNDTVTFLICRKDSTFLLPVILLQNNDHGTQNHSRTIKNSKKTIQSNKLNHSNNSFLYGYARMYILANGGLFKSDKSVGIEIGVLNNQRIGNIGYSAIFNKNIPTNNVLDYSVPHSNYQIIGTYNNTNLEELYLSFGLSLFSSLYTSLSFGVLHQEVVELAQSNVTHWYYVQDKDSNFFISLSINLIYNINQTILVSTSAHTHRGLLLGIGVNVNTNELKF